MSNFRVDTFVDHHRRLLGLERQHEVAESQKLRESLSPKALQERGICLVGLRVDDTGTGLGGRIQVRLVPGGAKELPSHRFQPGDLASLSEAADPSVSPVQGVIARVFRDQITISLDDEPDLDLHRTLRLDRLTDDITHRRLLEGLERLRTYRRGPARRLRECLLGLRDLEPPPLEPSGTESDPGDLNPSQARAVERALAAPVVSLIHGPPGTGKTTTLVEAITRLALSGQRVLACAASNVGVDNLVERLARRGVPIVRTGHPARVLPSVLDHVLDSQVQRDAERKTVITAQRELDRVRRRLSKVRGYRERRELRQEARALREEVRFLERAIIDKILDRSSVVLTTLVGAGSSILGDREFDWIVIDEAAQALEAACWIPLLRGERAILAGDHLQLPPTILSPEAEREGLGVTLFDRLAREHDEPLVQLLTTQYRMNERIMEFSSRELYEGRLEAFPGVAGHRLADLEGVLENEETSAVLLLVDTAGCDLEETVNEDDRSRSNPGEAEIVKIQLERLLEAGVPAADIAVITPYNAQVQLLRERLGHHRGLEIDTVDGFQGREKEAVILSLVRSNERGEVGFLADTRRLNVAVTRARRQLVVVGDTSTVTRNDFIDRLVEHLQAQGEYRSAWEYR